MDETTIELTDEELDTIYAEFFDEQVKNGAIHVPQGYFDDPKIREACLKVNWEK